MSNFDDMNNEIVNLQSRIATIEKKLEVAKKAFEFIATCPPGPKPPDGYLSVTYELVTVAKEALAQLESSVK